MKIFKSGSRPTKKASSDWFIRALSVSFEPGARTAWHTHPLGQTLYVIAGNGLIGLRNEVPKNIKAGDTVWIPPGEEHWHGASDHDYNSMKEQ